MKIAVFPGSFNPIHMGHLILGNYVTEFTDIDELWYLVTPQNPLKQTSVLADETSRLEMVQLALNDYTKLKASDFEFTLPRPSYTIDTLNALKKAYPQHDFSLLIGADNWEIFDKWKEHDAIMENYRILIYPRLGSRITIIPKLRNKIEILDSPVIEISSTFIRENIQNGKNMMSLLPKETFLYILEKKLYQKK